MDVRVVGQLVNDSGVQQTPSALLTDANLQAALDDGAGQIDLAVFVGQRYASTNLTSLTGQDAAILFRLNADLSYVYLRRRRGLEIKDEVEYDRSEKLLQALRNGDRVFSVPGAEAAGNPTAMFPSLAFYGQLNLMRDYAQRYYVQRRQQSTGSA